MSCNVRPQLEQLEDRCLLSGSAGQDPERFPHDAFPAALVQLIPAPVMAVDYQAPTAGAGTLTAPPRPADQAWLDAFFARYAAMTGGAPFGRPSPALLLSPNDLSMSGQAVNLVEGWSSSSSIPVASFTDADGNTNPSLYTATIDWGAGPVAAMVSREGSEFKIYASSAPPYAEEGSYPITVAVSDLDGASASLQESASVADAALSVGAPGFSAVPGQSFTVQVAGFQDSDPNGTAGDYAATIHWGDGSQDSVGTVSPANGYFAVSGTHTYAAAGTYSYSVRIVDAGGALVLAAGTANVAAAPVTAVNDAYSLSHDTTLTVPAATGVLANDRTGGQTVTIVLTGSPQHGKLTLGGDGSFVYVPDAAYIGRDHFDYGITAGGNLYSFATVSLTVTANLTVTAFPNVSVGPMAGNQAETTFAIDPTNSNRRFIAAVNFNGNGIFASYRHPDPANPGNWIWTARQMATGAPGLNLGDNLPLAQADPSAACDQFGNLFLVYISSTVQQFGQSTSNTNGLSTLTDMDHTWVLDQWVGCTLRITRGPGMGDTEYTIQHNDLHSLTIAMPGWDMGVLPTAPSTYTISAPRTSVVLVYSVDGGQTFQFLQRLEIGKAKALGPPPSVDQPTVATGPGTVLQTATTALGGANFPTGGDLLDPNQNWAVNQWRGQEVVIVAGTDAGDVRLITDNTSNTLTVDRSWTVPPDGTSRYVIRTGVGSVWVTWQSWSAGNAGDPMPLGTMIVAAGAPVDGLGAFGAFKATQIALGSSGGRFSDVKVGPTGQVLVSWQTDVNAAGVATISAQFDPDGLGNEPFDAVTHKVATTQVGFKYTLTAQPTNTVDAEASLAWDRSGQVTTSAAGRLYLVFTGRSDATNTNNTAVFITVSTNNGTDWSTPAAISDPNVHSSKFLPAVAVDQTTGFVAARWYDTRNDPTYTQAQIWATASQGIPVPPTPPDPGIPAGIFMPDMQVGAALCNGTTTGRPFCFGDYTGAAFYNHIFYTAWADNSNSTGDNPDGALNALDIYTAAVRVDLAP